jgi:ParB-like nuclease domain
MKNIDLDDLYCSVPATNYDQEQIELLALSIDATGGLLRPLIVKTLPVDQGQTAAFEVLDGFLAYYAARHAEANNILLNRVPCWVLADDDDLQFALQQLECLAEITADAIDYSLPIRGGVANES